MMMNIRGLAFDDPHHTLHLTTMELDPVDAYFQDHPESFDGGDASEVEHRV